MTRAAIALGSNLGDRLHHVRAGADGLAQLGEVVAESRLYETEPVGGPDQGRYLNAVVLLETEISPVDLMAELLEIERRHGRERSARWGPRTLDLDLISYGEVEIDLPTLQLPHPRAHERGFVLAPLADVLPEARLADGNTAASSLRAIGRDGLRAWHGAWRTEDPNLGREATWWVVGQMVLFLGWLLVVLATAQPLTGVRGGIGAVLVGSGVAVMELARRALGRNLTPFPQPRPGTVIVDTGIYGHVRHPIYTGVVMVLLGGSVLAGSWSAAVVSLVVGGFFLAKASVEERALSISVDGYLDYLNRVSRRFIPWVL